jgi:antitoxin MazE
MKAKVIQIGNSRGIRLPKPLIKEVGLNQEVDIHIRNGEIIITPIENTRSGWQEAAKKMHERKEDKLIDGATNTNFDNSDWEW